MARRLKSNAILVLALALTSCSSGGTAKLEDAAKDEFVQVILRQGEVQIHESCKPGKIKR